MLGAIIGDITGSIYEYENHRSKDFEIMSKRCSVTDDSIMTLAVLHIMRNGYINNPQMIVKTFKAFGSAYPNAGYGASFNDWLESSYAFPYNSYGNGAAMRVSPVAWFANSEEEVIDYATKVTEVTHDHPEGIKGAVVTAMCVYYARIGKTKKEIKTYVENYYDINFEYEDLRLNYEFDDTCQNSVPQAIYCFLISEGFEDCLRTAISIGGDSDTIASISGAIAEAYYTIPEHFKKKALDFLDKRMRRILESKYRDIRVYNDVKYEVHTYQGYIDPLYPQDGCVKESKKARFVITYCDVNTKLFNQLIHSLDKYIVCIRYQEKEATDVFIEVSNIDNVKQILKITNVVPIVDRIRIKDFNTSLYTYISLAIGK